MELKRALWNRYMAGAVIAAFLILGRAYVELWPGIKKTDVLSIITLPMALSGFTPFAAIFPVMPFALSFAEEYNSGYLRLAVFRQNRRKYMLRKLGTVAFSGGLMMATVFAFIFLIALFLGTPVTLQKMSGLYENGIWEALLTIWGGKLVLVLKVLLAFLFGAVWSTTCLLLSVIFPNRYVAFIGTFILYQALWQILPGSVFNPVYLLRADNTNYGAPWEPFAIQTVYLLVLITVGAVLMGRRLRDV